MIVDLTDRSFVHRVAGANEYYGSSTGKYDTVAIKADEEQLLGKLSEKEVVVWFARVLPFLQMKTGPDYGIACSNHNTFSFASLVQSINSECRL